MSHVECRQQFFPLVSYYNFRRVLGVGSGFKSPLRHVWPCTGHRFSHLAALKGFEGNSGIWRILVFKLHFDLEWLDGSLQWLPLEPPPTSQSGLKFRVCSWLGEGNYTVTCLTCGCTIARKPGYRQSAVAVVLDRRICCRNGERQASLTKCKGIDCNFAPV